MSHTQTKKYGRTLLLKPVNNVELSEKDFTSLTGMLMSSKTKTTSSYFLTFDTSANAQQAFDYVKQNMPNVLVKFSYYRVFFTVSGLVNSSDYNQVKEQFVNYIESTTKAAVLFFKLYKKAGEYIGCGDFTLDTLEGMNVLLDRDKGLKTFSLGELNGSFYRYNSYKSKDTHTNI
jgi:hypothetical protein